MTDAWHFLAADRHTRYEPRTLVTPGSVLDVAPPIKLCQRGLHASVRAIDALQYAPGPIICRVRLEGQILVGDDKLVATKRTVLWMADATEALHEMECISATTALLIADVDDQRCWNAIEAKRAWRRGEISDAELAAARAAAGAAAWDAARDAAKDAARDAAVAAARAAARNAARYAAGASAWAEQNYVLELLLNELPREQP